MLQCGNISKSLFPYTHSLPQLAHKLIPEIWDPEGPSEAKVKTLLVKMKEMDPGGSPRRELAASVRQPCVKADPHHGYQHRRDCRPKCPSRSPRSEYIGLSSMNVSPSTPRPPRLDGPPYPTPPRAWPSPRETLNPLYPPPWSRTTAVILQQQEHQH